MNEWVGRMLGKVRIESLIARGGMAEVYLGTHTTLQRNVAVKILRNQYEDDADLLERFQREARVVAKLRHQNIVQVFDYDTIDDHPYIVMEFVSGPSLSKYLGVLHKAKGRLELPEINRILNGVASALQYAHDSGVVHRDIKPGNIILTSHTKPINPGEPLPHDFQPVLTDFGLVRFLNSSRQTSAGQTAGTPAYMSPEQARGETTDGRTDIYSLGVVLYEMLAGKVPFDGETTMSILLKHIAEPPPPILGLSPQLQRVLDKALAKNREERFQKPIEFARAFKAVANIETEQSTYTGLITAPESDLQPSSIPVAEPVDSVIVVKPPQTPRYWLSILLGVIAVALLGVIFWVKGSLQVAANQLPTATQILVTTAIPVSPAAATQTPVAILHFRDKNAIMDQAVLEALDVPDPPVGSQYEAWFAGPSGHVSMGILAVNSGKGSLIYSAVQNENLFALYDQVYIVVKPIDASSTITERVAYSYTMPPEGRGSLQQLLVSSPDLPSQTALIQAISADTQLLVKSADDMLATYAKGDQAGTQKFAEAILNILAGVNSPDHKDWNGDQKISNLGDGFGFLRNGTNLGHIQDIFAQAEAVINSPNANASMTLHGSEAQVCTKNLSKWIADLNDQAQQIIAAASLKDMPVKEAASLIKKIQFGDDKNGNLISEPVDGECGVATLYKTVYAMADMPLFPIDLAGTAVTTVTSTSTPSPTGRTPGVIRTPTKSSGSGSGNTPVPAQNTKKPNPGGGGGGSNPPGHNKTPKP